MPGPDMVWVPESGTWALNDDSDEPSPRSIHSAGSQAGVDELMNELNVFGQTTCRAESRTVSSASRTTQQQNGKLEHREANPEQELEAKQWTKAIDANAELEASQTATRRMAVNVAAAEARIIELQNSLEEHRAREHSTQMKSVEQAASVAGLQSELNSARAELKALKARLESAMTQRREQAAAMAGLRFELRSAKEGVEALQQASNASSGALAATTANTRELQVWQQAYEAELEVRQQAYDVCSTQLAAAMATAKDFEQSLSVSRAELQQSRAQKEAGDAEHTAAADVLEAQLGSAKAELEALRDSITLAAQISMGEKSLKQSTADLAQSNEQATASEGGRAESQTELIAAKAALESLQQMHDMDSQELSAAKLRVTELETSLEMLEAQLVESRAQTEAGDAEHASAVVVLEAQLGSAKAELEALRDSITLAAAQISVGEKSLKQSTADLAQSKEQETASEGGSAESQTELIAAKAALESLQQMHDMDSPDLSAAKLRVTELETSLEMLEAQLVESRVQKEAGDAEHASAVVVLEAQLGSAKAELEVRQLRLTSETSQRIEGVAIVDGLQSELSTIRAELRASKVDSESLLEPSLHVRIQQQQEEEDVEMTDEGDCKRTLSRRVVSATAPTLAAPNKVVSSSGAGADQLGETHRIRTRSAYDADLELPTGDSRCCCGW